MFINANKGGINLRGMIEIWKGVVYVFLKEVVVWYVCEATEKC